MYHENSPSLPKKWRQYHETARGHFQQNTQNKILMYKLAVHVHECSTCPSWPTDFAKWPYLFNYCAFFVFFCCSLFSFSTTLSSWISAHFFPSLDSNFKHAHWLNKGENEFSHEHQLTQTVVPPAHTHTHIEHNLAKKWKRNSFSFYLIYQKEWKRKKIREKKINRKMHGKRNVLDTSSWFDCCWFSLSRSRSIPHSRERILTWHEIQQRRDPITNHFTCLSSISVLSPRHPRPPPPPTTREQRFM